MKLEPGKYYQTRDGEKALVKYVDLDVPPEAHHDTRTCFGYVWWDDGSFGEWAWKDDGMYEGGECSGQDLVSEWTEPEKITAKFFFDIDEKLCGFELYEQVGSTCKSFGNCINDKPVKKTVVKTVSFND